MGNEELHSEVLKYLGKIFKSDGVRKDKEGKEIAWKLWNLNFETGGQYPWKCGSFDPLSDKSVQLSAMVEGKFYEIVFKNTEYTHPEHGQVKSKQAVLIKESEEGNSTAGNLGNKQGIASLMHNPITDKVSAEGFVEFAAEYKETMKENGNAVHMLGLYVANKHSEQFSDIIALCKKEFSK